MIFVFSNVITDININISISISISIISIVVFYLTLTSFNIMRFITSSAVFEFALAKVVNQSLI